uniref:Shisa N-terminal domain-containing protein n=1 Tax=Astatotilapia calliptera TaxID=8154 RepID=A0AAX7T047_ASTCA
MIFPGGNMPLISVTLAVLAVVLSTSQVSGNEQCLWYVDKNGTWHNGFDCPLITFCCGNCNRRYCCLDAFKMITEREQKRCMLFQFSPTTLAGIASSILLFVAIIATMVCCFMCSCCYLYQRRQQRGRTPYDAQQIPMASYPVEPMYDAYGKPICPSEYPPVGYPMAPQYPGMPPQYPMMQPGPYVPRPMDPAYSQGKTCITSLRVSSHGCRVSWSCQYMSNHNQEQKLLLHVKQKMMCQHTVYVVLWVIT